jgi:GTP-sensing pleiotropic transcriptional regulator CodY
MSADLEDRALAVIRAHTGGDPLALTRYKAVADELGSGAAELRAALRELELAGLIEWRSNGTMRPIPPADALRGRRHRWEDPRAS